jgi:hypothetical protein
LFAGDVSVIGTYEILPVNFEESVPPKVSSPLTAFVPEVVGTYEIPMDSVGIVCCLNRLSLTVGTLVVDLTVPVVRSTGPMLKSKNKISQKVNGNGYNIRYPSIPSTPLNPVALELTPMDCFWMTRPGPRVTSSISLFL